MYKIEIKENDKTFVYEIEKLENIEQVLTEHKDYTQINAQKEKDNE